MGKWMQLSSCSSTKQETSAKEIAETSFYY